VIGRGSQHHVAQDHNAGAAWWGERRPGRHRNSPAREPLPPAPPTVRDVTNRLCRRPGTLTEDERPRLKAILGRCPELQAASAQVRGFATMITNLTGQDLPQWIAAAREAGLPGISSFAEGEQDLDAATNGLTMNWSSGSVEGRVNRIIMWNLDCQVRGVAIARTMPMMRSVAVIGQAVRQWHGQSLGPGPRRRLWCLPPR